MSVNHIFQDSPAPLERSVRPPAFEQPRGTLERLEFGYVKEQFEDSSGVRYIHVYHEAPEGPSGEPLWAVLEAEDETEALELLAPEQWQDP